MRRGDAVLGVLDWGIGGMGVVQALRRRAPGVPVLYLSDNGSLPYGKMPRAALAARVRSVVQALADDGALAVMVACNAASTVLGDLGGATAVPVFGVIGPALAMVAASFRTVGVLGGAMTVRSGLYRRGLERPGRRVVQRIAQPLSGHIEGGTSGSRACREALDRIMAPLRDADAIVLACTHYPAIADAIQTRAPRARLLDPADALAAQVLRDGPRGYARARDRLLTTGDPRAMRSATRRAWGFDPGPCYAVSSAASGMLLGRRTRR